MDQKTHKLRIDTNTVIQDNFLGLGAVYHGYMFQKDFSGRHYTPEQCEIELDRVSRSGLKIARTYYDYNFSWYCGKWDWDCPMMQGFYTWLEKMKERNVDVALNAAWCFPGDIDSTSGWPWHMTPFTVIGDWNASVNNYAWWVSESVYQIIEKRGFDNVRYLCMFTEPQHFPGSRMDDPQWNQFEAWAQCVRAVRKKLEEDGRLHYVKMVGPNEGSTDTSEMVKWVADNADDCVDIYSSHNYEGKGLETDNYSDWAAWTTTGMDNCAGTKKPFWFDEYGTFNENVRHNSAWYGTLLGIAQAAFMNCGAQTSILWTLFDQQWTDNHSNNNDSFYDGVHKHGIAPVIRESEIPRKSWYAFSMMSRFLGIEGTCVFKTEGTDLLHIAACRQPDGSYSILIVNGGKDKACISVDIGDDFDHRLYRRLYDPAVIQPDARADIPKIDGQYEAKKCFTDCLPPGAVAVYTTIQDIV